ncbi:MAG: peptidase M17, partial [Deltaproteobacteria bacterium]|nr:peptidase M17 [Deltaproteobacteria bacterium]
MIKLSEKDPESFDGDLLVYFIPETGKKIVSCSNALVRVLLKQAWTSGDFTGKKGQTFLSYPVASKKGFAAGRVLAVGLGKTEENEDDCREQIRLAAGTAATRAGGLKVKTLMAVLPEKTGLADADLAECMSEGLILGNYRFDKYKTVAKEDDKKNRVERFFLQDGGLNHGKVRRGMKLGKLAAEAGCLARDMANEPGNGWTPVQFAEFGKKIASRSGIKCRIIDKPGMKKLGMGGILGVNQGSALPPKLVILQYQGVKKGPTLM